MVSIEKATLWINLFGNKIIEQKEHLNQLDTAIGDGDHGSNLTRGANAIKEKMDSENYEQLSKIFQDVGMTMVSKVGGASGPLYGTAFIEMAKKANETSDVIELLKAGLEGIQKRGKADTGEKTMVDEWAPVIDYLSENKLSYDTINVALKKTKDMKATKGRASYLGDRSIGHIDPGAQSSAYFFETMLEAGVLDD